MKPTHEIANQMPIANATKLPPITSIHSSDSWVALMALPMIHIARAVMTPTAQKKRVPAMNRTKKGYPVFRE